MKLHVGCGNRYIPGYKHLDVIGYDHVDYVCDARNLSKIGDQTVSEIYACHILEHVDRTDVALVLREWWRVLEKGGMLRLAVPDFGAIVAEYSAGTGLSELQGLLYGGQTYDYNYHHTVFDFESLEAACIEAGFFDFRRYDWRDFLPADFDDYSRCYLPHMDFAGGRSMSLNVIAQKPE